MRGDPNQATNMNLVVIAIGFISAKRELPKSLGEDPDNLILSFDDVSDNLYNALDEHANSNLILCLSADSALGSRLSSTLNAMRSDARLVGYPVGVLSCADEEQVSEMLKSGASFALLAKNSDERSIMFLRRMANDYYVLRSYLPKQQRKQDLHQLAQGLIDAQEGATLIFLTPRSEEPSPTPVSFQANLSMTKILGLQASNGELEGCQERDKRLLQQLLALSTNTKRVDSYSLSKFGGLPVTLDISLHRHFSPDLEYELVIVKADVSNDKYHVRAMLQQNQRTRALALYSLGLQFAEAYSSKKPTLQLLSRLRSIIDREEFTSSPETCLSSLIEILDQVISEDIRISLKIRLHLPLLVRPSDLFRLAGHLILVACDYLGNRGECVVELDDHKAGAGAPLTITALSHSTDIESHDSEHLKDVLGTGDQNSQSNSFGLSAATQIAEFYRTEIQYKEKDGQSLRLRVNLPVKLRPEGEIAIPKETSE